MSIVFDDIIFRLQASGGASVYWREMTGRVGARTTMDVRHISGGRLARMVPLLLKKTIFHSSHFRMALGPGVKNVSTVHDLIYEKGMIKNRGAAFNILERKFSYFTADALVCISESTKRDLLEIYPTLEDRCPISVIHHGCSLMEGSSVQNGSSDISVVPGFEARCRHVLYIGGRKGYKNFREALRNFAISGLPAEGYELICTGAGFDPSEQKEIDSFGISSAVRCVGNVDTHQLIELYQNAFCLLYPSLYEGFGLPPIEAMHFGCPVIAVNTSSVPEVVGDAALLVDPVQSEQIAAALKKLTNPIEWRTLQSAGIVRARLFSWDRSADAHAALYQSLQS